MAPLEQAADPLGSLPGAKRVSWIRSNTLESFICLFLLWRAAARAQLLWSLHCCSSMILLKSNRICLKLVLTPEMEKRWWCQTLNLQSFFLTGDLNFRVHLWKLPIKVEYSSAAMQAERKSYNIGYSQHPMQETSIRKFNSVEPLTGKSAGRPLPFSRSHFLSLNFNNKT